MRVLLASDGSSDSRQATRWLRDLALPSDTRVTVLTVATLTAPPRDSRTTGELRENVVAEARRAGERAAKILRRRWPDVATAVAEGDPRIEVVRMAAEMRVDMIALGTRGLGPLIGSTSLAVARYAPCPVAIVRGRRPKVRRVLVAVDGSEGARAALRFLSTFELVRDTPVSLLRVLSRPAVPPLRRTATSSPVRRSAEARRQQQAASDEVLADAVAILGEARRPVERLVADGDPAREIVKVARRREADLVVLGARGLRTIGRLLLGSVSETVLHHVGRPVVIVREQ